MAFLIAALAAPVLGPLLYRALHPLPQAVHLVDGFVYVAVPALVAWQVLPLAWEQRSVTVLVAVAVGLLIPEAMERASRALAERTDDLAMLVGLSGLLLHALLEGAAFAPRAGPVDVAFGLAVVVHRIPVGLVIWWLVRPRHGTTLATLGVGAVIAATLAGFVLGSELLGDAHGPGVGIYQAAVSGSLVHVVFHQGRHDHDHGHDHDQDHDDHPRAGDARPPRGG